MLQIRGPLLPERLILQKDMENILRQAVEEESDLAGIHVDLENAKENSFTFSM